MGKSVLLLLTGYLVIFNIIALNISGTGTASEIAMYDSYNRETARNIAESGANVVLARLAMNSYWRGTKSNVAFGGGTFTTGAVTDTSLGPFGIEVYSYSLYNGVRDTVHVQVTVNPSSPAGARAGVTSNTEVATSGGLTIDGRDHDEFGNVIATTGTWGISTTTTTDLGNNSYIGGTDTGTDYSPLKVNNPGFPAQEPHVVETGAVWPGGFPDTPDLAMGGAAAGYPEGTLRAIAQSGINGSQYVAPGTDPNSSLSYPLRGVTYVDLSPGYEWIGIDFGDYSSGILVAHTANRNSAVKNLNNKNSYFKGLIIADDVTHVHCNVIGAVMVLTGSPPAGNVIGNGGGEILYSREMLRRAATGLPGVRCDLNILGWIY